MSIIQDIYIYIYTYKAVLNLIHILRKYKGLKKKSKNFGSYEILKFSMFIKINKSCIQINFKPQSNIHCKARS